MQCRAIGRLGFTGQGSMDPLDRPVTTALLYFPEGWTQDQARLRVAKAPAGATLKTKGEISLELIHSGIAEATIPGVTQGGPAHIAFEPKYLMGTSNDGSGRVMLEVSSPGLFTHRGIPHVLNIPMLVQWDGVSPEPPAPGASAPYASHPEDKPKRERGRRAKIVASYNQPRSHAEKRLTSGNMTCLGSPS